jgi:hypothetical protein
MPIIQKWSKPVISLLLAWDVAWVATSLINRSMTLHYFVFLMILLTIALYFLVLKWWENIESLILHVKQAPRALRFMLLGYGFGLIGNFIPGMLPATLILHSLAFGVGYFTRLRHSLSQGRSLEQLTLVTICAEILIQTIIFFFKFA